MRAVCVILASPKKYWLLHTWFIRSPHSHGGIFYCFHFLRIGEWCQLFPRTALQFTSQRRSSYFDTKLDYTYIYSCVPTIGFYFWPRRGFWESWRHHLCPRFQVANGSWEGLLDNRRYMSSSECAIDFSPHPSLLMPVTCTLLNLLFYFVLFNHYCISHIELEVDHALEKPKYCEFEVGCSRKNTITMFSATRLASYTSLKQSIRRWGSGDGGEGRGCPDSWLHQTDVAWIPDLELLEI